MSRVALPPLGKSTTSVRTSITRPLRNATSLSETSYDAGVSVRSCGTSRTGSAPDGHRVVGQRNPVEGTARVRGALQGGMDERGEQRMRPRRPGPELRMRLGPDEERVHVRRQ